MALKTINELPNSPLPLLGTDSIIVSRDGINVSKSTVGDLPLQLNTNQIQAGASYVSGITNDGEIFDSYGNIQDIKLDEFKFNPFGFNYYSLIYERLLGNTNAINRQPAIQIWLNGIYWQTKTANSLPDSIPNGTTIRLFGETNGSPVEMQDFALLPFANNFDIWRHMNGEVLPNSMFHIRTNDYGVIHDASSNKYPVTVASGITIQRT